MSREEQAAIVWTLGILSLGSLIVIGSMFYLGVTRHDERKASCEAAGGVYFAPQDGAVCLRSEAVIFSYRKTKSR